MTCKRLDRTRKSKVMVVNIQGVAKEKGPRRREFSSSKMSTSQGVSYDKGSNFQQATGISMIDTLTIETGSTGLDLGCGTGYLTKVTCCQSELDQRGRWWL